MAPKRSRNQASSSIADEEPKQWRSKPLSTLPKQWQPILYYKKLQGVKDIKDIIVAERTTKLEDFRYFGLYEGFERLGWLAALTINDEKEESEIYLDEILEWMSTLERDEGENPPWTTKLTGTVKGVPVVLSRATLRQIANFNALPEEEYEKKQSHSCASMIKVKKRFKGSLNHPGTTKGEKVDHWMWKTNLRTTGLMHPANHIRDAHKCTKIGTPING